MEYSVYDLIKIMLRKWYIVVVAMVVAAGVAIVASRISYERAAEHYETMTTPPEVVVAPTGDTVAQYHYTYTVTDMTRYILDVQAKDRFYRDFAQAVQTEAFSAGKRPSVYDEAVQALGKAEADFAALLTSDLLMRNVQETMNQAGVAADVHTCLKIEKIGESTLQLTVMGLNEEQANFVLDRYKEALTEVGMQTNSMKITVEEEFCNYYAAQTQDTTVSDLSQTVMKEPPAAPGISIRMIGTAAALAFVLTCFGILIVTFIKDAKKNNSNTAIAE